MLRSVMVGYQCFRGPWR